MCVEKICKYLLFLFNFCFWAAGVALLGVSIWLLVDDSLEDVVEVAGINIYTGQLINIVEIFRSRLTRVCIFAISKLFGCILGKVIFIAI